MLTPAPINSILMPLFVDKARLAGLYLAASTPRDNALKAPPMATLRAEDWLAPNDGVAVITKSVISFIGSCHQRERQLMNPLFIVILILNMSFSLEISVKEIVNFYLSDYCYIVRSRELDGLTSRIIQD